MNISKAKVKLIRSLDSKNARSEAGLFVAEGEKLVKDLLKTSLKCKFLVHSDAVKFQKDNPETEYYVADTATMKQISFLATPPELLGVFEIPILIEKTDAHQAPIICLDGIRDPGNFGTIVRTADWFGFHHIICSKDCVDAYNPKCIQASMGAIASVKIEYTDLVSYISSFGKSLPVAGTFMEGANIYTHDLQKNGFIVFGNEGTGISREVLPLITHKISIPSFGKKQAESLNVASSVAIIASEFRRQNTVF